MQSKNKAAHVRYTEAKMRLRATYDPNFIAALKAGVVDRQWDANTKEWVIDLREYKTALQIIRRFYGKDAVFEQNKPPEQRKSRPRQRTKLPPSFIGVATDKDYAVLHLLPSAPPELVKAAYRTLSKLYHPDSSRLPDADERMKNLNRAYEAIKKKPS